MSTKNKIFIGKREVEAVTVLDDKTPSGQTVVQVNYVDGDSETMPESKYAVIASAEERSSSDASDALFKRVSESMYAILVEYDLNLVEVDATITRMMKMANDALLAADNALWGVNGPEERRLTKINSVLMEAVKNAEEGDKDEDTDGATSERGGADSDSKK